MTTEPATSEHGGTFASYALKDDQAFLVADARGDVSSRAEGLFRDDTRILSYYRLTVGDCSPSLLSAGVSRDNVVFRAHLTNRRLPDLGGRRIPEGVIHIERERVLCDGRLSEQIVLTNYGSEAAVAPLTLHVDADFADIFEVRGHVRARRGRVLPPLLRAQSATLRYEGLDGIERTCTIAFSRAPDKLTFDAAHFALVLEPQQWVRIDVEIGAADASLPCETRFRHAMASARLAMRRKRRRGASIRCRASSFQRWLERSRADLALLTAELATGPYPCAGIPWFATPFGRDGIVTALQMLWLDPSLARGVLAFLAATQAAETNPFQDAQPGKILHETRKGEMAMLGEVPFRRYYGGVDATPLFVVLAGAYAERTGDASFVDALWPSLTAAMNWIDGLGDSNRDGFLDYAAARPTGLANQGWKDSGDSVFHSDGRLPPGPIALVEVQGYVYAAKRTMATLCAHRGEHEAARRWRHEAESLRERVEAHFWQPDLGFYALALDGEGAPCSVRASNAGHLLYALLPHKSRALQVAESLLSTNFDSGWGLRTLARGETRFNPMSYHNGSIWPHDTALCAAGIARYGDRRSAARMLLELHAAAVHFDFRLPELYCGFARRPGEPPVGYPVACLPQAWSSGAVFMLLEACLGVAIDGRKRSILVDHPELPAEVDCLDLRGLELGDSRVDLRFERTGGGVAVTVPQGMASSVRLVVTK